MCILSLFLPLSLGGGDGLLDFETFFSLLLDFETVGRYVVLSAFELPEERRPRKG